MKKYYYSLLEKFISLHAKQEDTVIFLESEHTRFFKNKEKYKVCNIDELHKLDSIDYLVVPELIHYTDDVQRDLTHIYENIPEKTKVIILYLNNIWRPALRFATRVKLRERLPEINWISHNDVDNLAELSNFQYVTRQSKVLFPFYIPIISNFINSYLSQLPIISAFNLVNYVILNKKNNFKSKPNVSIVVAARNEKGNIVEIINRIPQMGDDDELIFIEGGSTDGTWDEIQQNLSKSRKGLNIIAAQQTGKGKGDAVRLGFDMATKDIFMILDADMTVMPEDLPKFYNAIVSGKGEYINGSRLVYPMEKKAMRFFNMLGNKFFAYAFSYVLGQKFNDTLCGTKVLSKTDYQKVSLHRKYFGDFDPFGDFDLIFGAARIGLKTIEIPIRYRARTYGDTNISRWTHGLILLRMLVYAARKIKFI